MRLAASDQALLATIRAETKVQLREVLRGSDRVALIDFPSHQNAGDSLIWAGEKRYLKEMGVEVVYEADAWRFDEASMRERLGGGPILLHGGGNFGDLWPTFQAFRERVIERCVDQPIVQLSQSVFFEHPASEDQFSRVAARHPDFTLLVRDDVSLARARRVLPESRIRACADMAFGLGEVQPPMSIEPGLLLLFRGDHEAVDGLARSLDDIDGHRVDWGLSVRQRLAWNVARAPLRADSLTNGRVPERLIRLGYAGLSRLNVDAAVKLVGSYRAVVTDRLHVHLLACLMGIPHVVLDNANGKVRALYEKTTYQFSAARYASNAAEARSALADILSAQT